MAPRKDIRNEEDRARLPVWAQTDVEGLLREVKRLHGLVDELLAGGPANGDTFVSGGHVEPDRPLGTGPTVNFGVEKLTLDPGREVTEHILDARWDAESGRLLVSAYNGRVNIRPTATNTFEVTVTHH